MHSAGCATLRPLTNYAPNYSQGVGELWAQHPRRQWLIPAALDQRLRQRGQPANRLTLNLILTLDLALTLALALALTLTLTLTLTPTLRIP